MSSSPYTSPLLFTPIPPSFSTSYNPPCIPSVPLPNQPSIEANSLPSTTQPTTTDLPTEISPSPTHEPSLTTHPMLTRSKTGSLKPKIINDMLHSTLDSTTPTTYSQAVQHPSWRTAMSQEFQVLQSQGTWSLVPTPTNQTILGCRWTYRTKYNTDDTIARHKAQLVSQGHKQEQGVYYTETFSPVAKLPTIRVLLIVAAYHNLE